MKKYIIAAASALCIAAASAAVIFLNNNVTVMEINGIKVGKEEFKLAMNENISSVYSYFSGQYGTEDSTDFWQKEFDGITPEEYSKSLAKDYLIDKKCRMKLMLDNGIITDAGYARFKRELKQVNAERQRIKDSGGVIYGPVQYSEKEYDIYLMSNREIELKRKLEQVQCSDEEILGYYNENKDTKYKIQDTLTIDAEGQIMEFTPQLSRHDSTAYPEIYDAAYKLNDGGECDVSLSDGETVHIRCISRKDNGYMSYDEAYDSAKEEIVNGRYDKLIEELKAEAEVRVNEAVYKRIKMD